VKKSPIQLLLLLFLVLLASCSESEESSPAVLPQPSLPKVQTGSSSFQEPSSTRISEVKARQFAEASTALFLLGQQWSERLEKANSTEKVQILHSYAQAREQLAVKLGLAGIAEFEWLQNKALKDPVNKGFFASAGIKVPQ